jgi:hypothetical protein
MLKQETKRGRTKTEEKNREKEKERGEFVFSLPEIEINK